MEKCRCSGATRGLLIVLATVLLMMLGSAAYADELSAVSAGEAVDGQQAALSDEAAAGEGGEAQALAQAERKAKLARRTIRDGLYTVTAASRSGYAISVAGESRKAGAKVVLAVQDASMNAQKWAVTWDSDSGYYKIRNLGSRMFLGVSQAVKPGASLKQFKRARSVAQLWEAVKVGGGISFRPAGSKLALAAAGGKKGAPALKLKAARSAKSQAFILNGADALDAGKTYFISSVSSGARVCVAGKLRASGASVGLAAPADTKGQKFRLIKAGSAYRLQNVKSCYYVGAKGASANKAVQVSSKARAGTWAVKLDLKSAAFTISSKKTGKRFDASGKLKLKKASGSDAQLFTFAPTYAFKLYLNPGHGWNSNNNGIVDPGASGNGHTEAEFSHDLAHRVEALLAGTDVKVINGERFGLAFWRRMPKAVKLGCDAIVSIHFDAGGGSGTLGMVGMQGKAPGSDTLSRIIREKVVASLGLTDRGPVTRSDITCVNGPIPSMLVEVCFMDNAHDVATYLKKRDAVARGLADGILKATRTRAVVR